MYDFQGSLQLVVRVNHELSPHCGDNLYVHRGATLSPIMGTIFHKDLKKI